METDSSILENSFMESLSYDLLTNFLIPKHFISIFYPSKILTFGNIYVGELKLYCQTVWHELFLVVFFKLNSFC